MGRREVSWDDPRTLQEPGRRLSGVEFLRSILRGELPGPPIGALLGMRIEEVDEGRVVFSLEPSEAHYNPAGVVHGGVVTTLADTAMACAVHSSLPAGAGCTTIELSVNFVRAVSVETGRLHCEGRLVHAGGRVATAEARVVDAAGALYAHGTSTCLLLR
jgi:uncharacterized protein (TIGR00369 family)